MKAPNISKGEWKATAPCKSGTRLIVQTEQPHVGQIAEVWGENNARAIAAIPDLLAALNYAAELIKVARNYFPKSIHSPNKFQLENTCAAVTAALKKAGFGE